MAVSPAEMEARARLARDFPLYAHHVLKIRTKLGKIEPLRLNKAQLFAHQSAEDQLVANKRVRSVVLKARQQGLSTYIEGRFYWKVTHNRGLKAYILTHEAEATANLFDMVERYYENTVDQLKPHLGASNARELFFDRMDSGYKVGTAGAKATGRSQTVQLFHGSEVGFWPQAEEHVSGVLQAIPSGEDGNGSEIWIESTANGMGNWFQRTWAGAVSGDNDFQPIFIPWFWDVGYQIPGATPRLSSDEEELQARYSLSLAQMAWRQKKIRELGDARLFRQEYPAEAIEAFDLSGDLAFITRQLVIPAMRAREVPPFGAMVLGVDPARFGSDKTAIALREGRVCHWIRTYQGLDTMEVVGRVVDAARQFRVKRVFVDVVGLGAGVVDRLRELGVDVVGVNGGATPLKRDRFLNKRAEMWGEMKAWLMDRPCQIPPDEALAAELTSLRYRFDSKSRLILESKDDAAKRGVHSPDRGDALALTFAAPVSLNRVESFEPGREIQRLGYQSFEPEIV